MAGPDWPSATTRSGESDIERHRSWSRPAATAAARGRDCECESPAATSRSGSRSSGSWARRSPASRPAAFRTALPRDSCSTTVSSSDAPISARRRSTSALVSSGPIGVDRIASIGPASSSCTTRMMVMPVSASPAITARCTGAAPRYFGQQRSVDVDHAEPRDAQERVRQDPPVRGDDAEVGPERGHRREKLVFLEPGRAEAPERRRATASSLVGVAATRWPRPFGRSGCDTTADDLRGRRLEEGRQRRHRELRRAEVDDSQRRRRHHRPARFSLWIFRTIRSLLIPRSRSMNTVPSR